MMLRISDIVTKNIKNRLSVHVVTDPQWSGWIALYETHTETDLFGEEYRYLDYPNLNHSRYKLDTCYAGGIYEIWFRDILLYIGMSRSSDDRGVLHRISDRRSTLNQEFGWTSTEELISPYDDTYRMMDIIEKGSELLTANYIQGKAVKKNNRFLKNILDIRCRVKPLIFSEGVGGDDYSAAYCKAHEVQALKESLLKYGQNPRVNIKQEYLTPREKHLYDVVMSTEEMSYLEDKEDNMDSILGCFNMA